MKLPLAKDRKIWTSVRILKPTETQICLNSQVHNESQKKKNLVGHLQRRLGKWFIILKNSKSNECIKCLPQSR